MNPCEASPVIDRPETRSLISSTLKAAETAESPPHAHRFADTW